MHKKKIGNESNFANLTGILVNNRRNADSRDIKRPVFDMEITNVQPDGSYVFETIPVVIPDANLAKMVSGMQVGEILTITGYLRSDYREGMYVEASEVMRISFSKGSQGCNRAQLLQVAPRFNEACIVGTITRMTFGSDLAENENYLREWDSSLPANIMCLWLELDRAFYSKGDLKYNDSIPVLVTNDGNTFRIGDQVCCIGSLSNQHKPHIYCSPDAVHKIIE